MRKPAYTSLLGQDDTTIERQAEDGSSTNSVHKQPTTQQASSSEEDVSESLLKIDQSRGTYRACVFGLVLTWLAAFASIVGGAVVQRITDTSGGYEPQIQHHRALSPFLRLVISFTITALSDLTGLIHASSLRFTLLEAGKLTFNSNLRLFTSCYTPSRLHWWPVNIIWGWSLISTYACGSMILLQSVYDNDDGSDIVSGYALIFMGFGLLGQSIIATLALRANKSNFFTWYTNPIYIANICLQRGYLKRLPNRTILSVHDASKIQLHNTPTRPSPHQRSLLHAHPQIRRVIIASWLVALTAFLFFAFISLIYQLVPVRTRGPAWGTFAASYSNDWSLIPDWKDTTAFLALGTSLGYARLTFGPWLLCKYLFTSVFMGTITMNLHNLEIIVQTSRDESLWRTATTPSGLNATKHGGVFTALASWQSIGLFIFKGLIHWFFSLAFGLMWEGVKLFIPQFLFTACLLLVLAGVATGTVLWRPRGPQPATFGHLQTLVDLIDVWPEKGEVMYWGDKGVDGREGVRRAGTATVRLEGVDLDKEYL